MLAAIETHIWNVWGTAILTAGRNFHSCQQVVQWLRVTVEQFFLVSGNPYLHVPIAAQLDLHLVCRQDGICCGLHKGSAGRLPPVHGRGPAAVGLGGRRRA